MIDADTQVEADACLSSTSNDGGVPPLRIGSVELSSRLIMGSGRFASLEVMREALMASGCHAVTIAVRRERLHDAAGRNILDFLDLDRWVLLPNTAGCFDAETAVRAARMGREILTGLGQTQFSWVKLEVLSDSSRMLPDPIETLRATEQLVGDGFDVLCYCSDDPALARQLQRAGAVCVMPGGSPIGSGLGILNPFNIRALTEELKSHVPDYPVLVDAGVGSAGDVVAAMELGVDGVMVNTAVAKAGSPVEMAQAIQLAVVAGWRSFRAGRMPKLPFASASSPELGVIASRRST
ncbi:MAG TPA: thiazole synthase [Pirellulaceae bacterium]|nr:thiazole synthase [Pirellulaceae bacterium]